MSHPNLSATLGIDLSASGSELLELVRGKLQSLEDTIIRALVERFQYCRNPGAYEPHTMKTVKPGQSEPETLDVSFFDFLFKETEAVHARCGRFEAFDEFPFYPGHPSGIIARGYKIPPVLPGRETTRHYNGKIRESYLAALLKTCPDGDEMDSYGDTIIRDIAALQAISQRVHFGRLVMEAKYRSNMEVYHDAVARNSREDVLTHLTDAAKEAAVLQRVAEKADKAGLSGAMVAGFYEYVIIPLTKEVEVDYMFDRIAHQHKLSAAPCHTSSLC